MGTSSGGDATLGGDDTIAGEHTLAGESGAASRTMIAPRAPTTGDVIGRYVVLDVLGRGGMGVVLAAYDPELDRKVALKLVRPDRAADTGEIEREARMIAKLRHPNLVTVHDVGTTDAGVFLAMEFIDGVTLREYQRGDRSWRELAEAYLQAARGLAAVHEAGVVHGDFKPENVFVGTLGGRVDVKVLDFGLAQAAGTTANASGASGSIPTGTLAYMGPERIRGDVASALADQFAFCVALFEALDGKRPYDLETLAAPSGGSRSPPVWGAGLRAPAWMRALALRGLALDPEARWPSMDALALALERGPGRARRRVLALGGTTALIGAIVLAATRPDPCADADADVRAIWSPAVGQHARAAIADELGNGGDHGFDRIDKTVTRFTQELADAARRQCAMRRSGDTLLENRRQRCIDAGVSTIEVWAEALASDRPDQLRAVLVEAAGWSPPISCLDDAALISEPDPPDSIEPATARAYLRRLGSTGLSRYFNEAPIVEAELDALVAELRDLGDPTLLAEALYRRGAIATRGGALADGYTTMLDALRWAESAGAARLQALIWHGIAENRQMAPDGEGLEALAVERAAAASERLGSPAELHARILIARANVASRGSDYAGADSNLREAIDVARASDLIGFVLSASRTRVIALLHSDRVDDALAVGAESELAAERYYGREHPETAIALGSHAAALFAAGRFDEARTRTTSALERLDRWRPFGVASANGIACNWCNGVGRGCRATETIEACTSCADRVLRTPEPTAGSHTGLVLALSWLRIAAPAEAAVLAKRVAAHADSGHVWAASRGIASLVLLASDPETALQLATAVCPAPDSASCTTVVNAVIARLEPDSRRRAAALAAVHTWWQKAGHDDRQRWIGIGTMLADEGLIARSEIATALADARYPCDAALAAARAWLDAPSAPPQIAATPGK